MENNKGIELVWFKWDLSLGGRIHIETLEELKPEFHKIIAFEPNAKVFAEDNETGLRYSNQFSPQNEIHQIINNSPREHWLRSHME